MMMVNGVRNSCAALAVNWRWMTKPCSRRSSARLTASTSGRASAGTSASGRRIEIDPGPILLASADAVRSGRILRRTLRWRAARRLLRGRNIPSGIENKLPWHGMDQLVAARYLGHRHRERTGGAVEQHADPGIVLP